MGQEFGEFSIFRESDKSLEYDLESLTYQAKRWNKTKYPVQSDEIIHFQWFHVCQLSIVWL